MDTPHILQDILTFLCWLKSHDIRLRGKTLVAAQSNIPNKRAATGA
jgi:hypothetical protein